MCAQSKPQHAPLSSLLPNRFPSLSFFPLPLADAPQLVAGTNTTSLEFSSSEEGSTFFCGCAWPAVLFIGYAAGDVYSWRYAVPQAGRLPVVCSRCKQVVCALSRFPAVTHPPVQAVPW